MQVVERRAHNRYAIDRDATASLGALILSQRCRILDASVGGLGVWLNGTRLVPLEFDLIIEGNLLPVSCHLIWRVGDFVGVRFVHSTGAAGLVTWEGRPDAG